MRPGSHVRYVLNGWIGTIADMTVNGAQALVYWNNGATSVVVTSDLTDLWRDAR